MAKMLKRLESEARVLIIGSLVMCCRIGLKAKQTVPLFSGGIAE